jgi:hypothetical protein
LIQNLSYWGHRKGRGGRRNGVTNVDWVYVSIVVGVHVPIWEQAIGKEGEEDKFREG